MVGAAGLAVGALAGSLAGSIGDARAQSQDERFSTSPRPGMFTGGTGSFHLFGGGPPAPVGPANKDDWSGESGSSGHPLMQADAIRAAAANFPNCIAGFWPDAARRGVTRATFDTYTAGLAPDLKIMDFVDSQPEFSELALVHLVAAGDHRAGDQAERLLEAVHPAAHGVVAALGAGVTAPAGLV